MATRSQSKQSWATNSRSSSTSIQKRLSKLKLPRIIGVANQKGGVAKTTTAIHLQAWLTRNGHKAILVDADGQESSSAWAQDLNLPFQALHNPEDLFEKLPVLAKDAIVIVDGPANAGEVTKAILNRAELAIIPSKQSMIDLRSFGDIVRIVGHIQELRSGLPKAALFLSDINPQTVLYREAKEALSAFQITLLETAIPHRTCIEDCSGQGQTVFDMKGSAATAAQANYNQLFLEMLELYTNG